MSDWLWSRLKFLGDLRKHRIARWVFLVWAIIAVYDTGGSQLLPTEWVQKRPTVYQVLVVSTGWLSWEVWLLIGAASLALFGVEVGVRHKGRVATNTQPTDRITQVVGRARIAFAHGRAFSDESPRGITHIE